MYYQVLIETAESNSTSNKKYFELDKTSLEDIEDRIVYPFLKKENFQFDGYFLRNEEIRRITIKETQKTTKELSEYENRKMPPGVIMYVSQRDVIEYEDHAKDITAIVFDKAKLSLFSVSSNHNSGTTKTDKIFIVHGRDDHAKISAARFVEKLGLSAVILHEQANSGKTIIEKIEEYTNVGFAIVLYTPCDIGGLANEEQRKARARQNVVFEHGYLIGKLGRQNVCALVKGDIETPNDISGIAYIPLDQNDAWHLLVAKELVKAGYNVNMNSLL